jgi:hypothetical protein
MINKQPRIFYGWLIVFLSAIGLFLGAPLAVFSFSVFFKSLVVDFHASQKGCNVRVGDNPGIKCREEAFFATNAIKP